MFHGNRASGYKTVIRNFRLYLAFDWQYCRLVAMIMTTEDKQWRIVGIFVAGVMKATGIGSTLDIP